MRNECCWMYRNNINSLYSTIVNLTLERTMASTLWAVSKFCGYGIPCATMVDSNATTGSLFFSASSTTVFTCRILCMLEDVCKK